MPFRLLTTRNGYESTQYKAAAGLFGQMQPAAEKTMANCRESAHAPTMSEQHHVFVRRYGRLPA
jgi:hypothetical protein